MGVKNLNSYLKSKIKNNKSINKINMSLLAGKTIVVDTSIYLYQYYKNNNLLENMFHMLSLFCHYKINGIFVFDGKPPTEKYELMDKRKLNKINAEKCYKEFIKKNDILNSEKIKKEFIRIPIEDINTIKNLINSFGYEYINAYGESDELCALLVKNNIAWGCLSDDMDLFVYGCNNILRSLNLYNYSMDLYNTEFILNDLNINLNEFQNICILSGTDYNIYNNVNNDINYSFNLFYEYKENKENNLNFYEWVKKYKYENINSDLMNNINKMFDLSNIENKYIDIIHNIKAKINSMRSVRNINEIKNIMIKDGFIFPLNYIYYFI